MPDGLGDISMTDTYRGGYKKALLDILEFQDQFSNRLDSVCRTKKQYKKMMSSLINLLLTNPEMLDIWMEYNFDYVRLNKDYEVVEIIRRKK